MCLSCSGLATEQCGWGPGSPAAPVRTRLQEAEKQRFQLEQRILELEGVHLEHYVRAEDAAALAGARLGRLGLTGVGYGTGSGQRSGLAGPSRGASVRPPAAPRSQTRATSSIGSCGTARTTWSAAARRPARWRPRRAPRQRGCRGSGGGVAWLRVRGRPTGPSLPCRAQLSEAQAEVRRLSQLIASLEAASCGDVSALMQDDEDDGAGGEGGKGPGRASKPRAGCGGQQLGTPQASLARPAHTHPTAPHQCRQPRAAGLAVRHGAAASGAARWTSARSGCSCSDRSSSRWAVGEAAPRTS
jgi:hypothetical protein